MTFTHKTWGMDSIPSDEWLEHAACNPTVAELFWPIGYGIGQDISRALTICGNCPVIEQCGTWAVEHKVRDGIWGGMREDQLRRLTGGPLDARRTHVDAECVRCGKFRDLTARLLCLSCTSRLSAKRELDQYPSRRDRTEVAS